MSLKRLMAYIAFAGTLFALLAGVARDSRWAREAARCAHCVNNLKQIGVALGQYENTYGCLPPAFVTDAKGKPLSSWRVLVAAEMDRADGRFGGRFARDFRFDLPWDSPNNLRLDGPDVQNAFWCPSHPPRKGSAEADYVVVQGRGTAFPADGSSRRLSEIADGPEGTLTVVEVAGLGIHWMEPRDLAFDAMTFRPGDRSRAGIASHHPAGGYSFSAPHVLSADGMVTTLSANTAPETVRALLTISGGEPVPRDRWDARK